MALNMINIEEPSGHCDFMISSRLYIAIYLISPKGTVYMQAPMQTESNKTSAKGRRLSQTFEDTCHFRLNYNPLQECINKRMRFLRDIGTPLEYRYCGCKKADMQFISQISGILKLIQYLLNVQYR